MTEEQLHRACAALLRLYEARGLLLWIHVPNGGKRTRAESGLFKALGVVAGVPDLLIFLPGGALLQVELKSATGRLSMSQRAWHLGMAGLGHEVRVCRSVDDLETALREAGVPAIGTLGRAGCVQIAQTGPKVAEEGSGANAPLLTQRRRFSA